MAFIPGVSAAPDAAPPFSGATVQTKPLTVLSRGQEKQKPVPDVQIANPYLPDFIFGSATKGTVEKLADRDEIKVGDTVRLTYRMNLPFLQNWQSGYIVSKLSTDDRIRLIHVATFPESRKLIIEAQVLKPMSPAIIFAGLILAALVGATIFLTLDKVERIGSIKVGGFSFSFVPIVLLLVVIGFLLPKAFKVVKGI